VTKASFISSGNTPREREEFTMAAIGTARYSANFLRREVGIGSREEDLEGHSLIRETISGTVTLTNEEKGGTFSGESAAG